MAFTGTSLLSLPIITTGTESGAWGNITNNGLTQYLDTSIAGALSITSSITLANTSGDASGTNLASTTAQYRTLVVPASGPSANIVITAPSSNRTYHVVNRNATYTVQIRAGANSGVTLGVNQSATVTYNSTSADYELVGVVGASTATDNAVARFDGTTGEIIQNSGATIDDSANFSTTGTATATKLIPTGNVTAGNGMYLPAANTLAWSNNGAETMRIDSSGNVLVGQTSYGAETVGVGVNPAGLINIAQNNSTSSGTGIQIYSTAALAYRFYVTMAGTIFATSTTITGISDQRLKENIRDLDDGLEKVMALQPRKFDWKEGKGADIKNARGFIAQEFETVFPDLISTWKDPAPDGEEPYKSVRADLIPTLVKAIQEQQALINELRARVAALESQP